MSISTPYTGNEHSANTPYTGADFSLPSQESPNGRILSSGQDVDGEDNTKRAAASAKDVEELDDEGWRFASQDRRIEELGSLGEGAGGAVTKCKLKNGQTLFALKVILIVIQSISSCVY